MNGVFFSTEFALLAALPVAFIVTRLVVRFAAHRIRTLALICIALLALVAIAFLTGVSLRGINADIALLVVTSLAYSTVFVLAFRLKPLWLRLVTVPTLGAPIALGYLVGTLGLLAVAFMSGDVGDSVTQTSHGVVCRTQPFGNATTSVNGYFVRVYSPFGVFERQRFKAQYPDPITPEEACARAIAAAMGS